MAGIAAARLSTATPATFVGRSTWIPRQWVPAPDKGGGGAGTKPGAGQGLDIPGERSFNRPGGQVAPGRGVFGHRFPAGGSSRPADIAPEPGDRGYSPAPSTNWMMPLTVAKHCAGSWPSRVDCRLRDEDEGICSGIGFCGRWASSSARQQQHGVSSRRSSWIDGRRKCASGTLRTLVHELRLDVPIRSSRSDPEPRVQPAGALGVMKLIEWATERLYPSGGLYFDMLDRVHQHLLPRTYVEIGVNNGRSFALALPGTDCVGIDPEPQMTYPTPPGARVYATTSDEFFEKNDLAELFHGVPLDLAFIDGMHHFEFALRDFINIERASHQDTSVLIHDCLPVSEVSASRERSEYPWSGDVWRLILALRRWRPDLSVFVVDWAPTGVGVVRGLDPKSNVLADRYDEIVAEMMSVPYSSLDDGTMNEQLQRVPADWPTVRSLLPDRPFRQANLDLLMTRRTLFGVLPAVSRAYNSPQRKHRRNLRSLLRKRFRRKVRRRARGFVHRTSAKLHITQFLTIITYHH